MFYKCNVNRKTCLIVAPILFLQLILCPLVWGEETKTVQKKETSFWDVVLFPLNIVKVPIYALKYSTKPAIGFIDKHPVLLYWLSGTVQKHYRSGMYPTLNVGGIEGVRGELIFFDNNFLVKEKKLKLRLSYSTHAYQNYQISWGVIKLVPASLFYNFLIRYSQSPREPFYGLGPDTKKADKSTYNWERASIGATVGKKLSTNVDLLADLVFTYNNILKGRDPRVLSTGEIFDSSELPGLSTKIKLLTAELTLIQDGRNSPGNPSRGGVEKLSVNVSEGIDDNLFRFGQVDLELERFFEIFKHRVFALRLYASHTLIPKNYRAPFFSFHYLGGSENLRGYSRNRFIDKGLVLGSLEYRYPVWNSLDAFLFIDEGQVFSNIPDLQLRLFKDSKGGGLRIYNHSGLILRSQIGFSREQTKIYLDISKFF